MIVTGAVNGVPTTANVQTSGSNLVTIPFFPGGTTTTLDVNTDGSGLHATNHRVAGIFGDVSGRDHFPFSVANKGATPTGDATQFPFTVPVDRLSFMFYAVKKWHVSYEYSFTDETGTYDGNDRLTFQNWVYNGSIWVSPGNESQWSVLPQSDGLDIETDGAGFIYLSAPGDGGVEVTDFSTSRPSDTNELQLAFDTSSALWDAGSIWLRCFVHGSAGGNEFGSEGAGRLVGELFLDDARGSAYTTNIYVLDGDGPLTDLSVSIAPIEFWPYATTTGAAVYNTSTGAQLADPLS